MFLCVCFLCVCPPKTTFNGSFGHFLSRTVFLKTENPETLFLWCDNLFIINFDMCRKKTSCLMIMVMMRMKTTKTATRSTTKTKTMKKTTQKTNTTLTITLILMYYYIFFVGAITCTL